MFPNGRTYRPKEELEREEHNKSRIYRDSPHGRGNESPKFGVKKRTDGAVDPRSKEAKDFRSRVARWKDKSPLFLWRQRQNITQADACALLGLSFTTYQKWESGMSMPNKTVKVFNDDMTEKVKVNFNDHIKLHTGVSLERHMRWLAKRPKRGLI